MQTTSHFERKKQIQFAIAIAALNGGQPTAFTQNLLSQYEQGDITSTQLKRAIVEKYKQKNHE